MFAAGTVTNQMHELVKGVLVSLCLCFLFYKTQMNGTGQVPGTISFRHLPRDS